MELQSQKNTLIFSSDLTVSPQKEKENGLVTPEQYLKNQVFEDLINEAGEELFNFLDSRGITVNTNIILLSSFRHYLYESEELKHVKTIVNLRPINNIRFVRYCLNALNRILPIGGTFIGCYIDSGINKNRKANSRSIVKNNDLLLLDSFENKGTIIKPFYNWFYKIINSNYLKFLSRNKVVTILEKGGFLITETVLINGITYFISKKIKSSRAENSAYFKRINKC